MPLKKPGEIPKVPKTRAKGIDKVKSATPGKKKGSIEYTASVYFRYDVARKKQFYTLSIYTVKEFSSMSYEIAVQVHREKRNIDISLLGLNMRQTYYFQAKGASVDIDFEDLFGVYTLSIIKQDGSINSYEIDFNIFKKDITLTASFLPKKKNNRQFSTLAVEREKFTFAEEKN